MGSDAVRHVGLAVGQQEGAGLVAADDDITVGQLIDQLRQFDPLLLVVIEHPTGLATLGYLNPPCGDRDEIERGVSLVTGRAV